MADKAPDEDSLKLVQELGITALVAQLCRQRGLCTPEEVRRYLQPELKDLTDPFQIRDMDRAVTRLMDARDAGERVRVFGDYDVDGTCGAALLQWTFGEMGFQIDARQPDRFKDGYGLNVKAVEDWAAEGGKLLISVDCGITSFAAAQRAQELGIDLIIVDHHQVDVAKGLPPAFAILDPQRTDCPSGLRELCGCGLAFFLSMAVRAKGRERGWFADGKEPQLKKHLDLVVLATAADLVPLVGNNRILVRHGLEVLKRTEKPGLRALLEVAGVEVRLVSPGHLGFTLGPRINASGRIQNANTALRLLTTKNPLEALELARELERLNEERKGLQNQIWDEIKEQIQNDINQGLFQHGIVVGSERWHEGVVGIVASRVTEQFRRPAIVISFREGHGKGSARSYGGKNVLDAIRACGECLEGFGGHAHAAGVSLKPENLSKFAEAFNMGIQNLPKDTVDEPPLVIDGECTLQDLLPQVLFELEQLGPFGPGNPEPVFRLRAQVRSFQVLKERHLKMRLGSSNPDDPSMMEAIWFHAAEDPAKVEQLMSRPIFEWAGVPELNRFRGRITPTFRVRDQKDLTSSS